MTLDARALDELVDTARQHGGVSIEDVRRRVPIERMTVEELSHVLARLDEEGLDLEIDPMTILSADGAASEKRTSTLNRDQAELPAAGLEEPESGFRTYSGKSSAGSQTVRSSDLPSQPPCSLGCSHLSLWSSDSSPSSRSDIIAAK